MCSTIRVGLQRETHYAMFAALFFPFSLFFVDNARAPNKYRSYRLGGLSIPFHFD